VDFGRIALDEEIRIDVGLDIHGTPVGVADGGVLKVGIRQVTIACLPANIPDHIRVEVTGLALGDTLHVRDIVPPEGIRIVTDADAVVAQVRIPAKAAPVAAEAAPEVAEVEAPAGAEASEEPKAPGKKEKQE
jgi:large subunit ribosomal protein L25